MATDFALGAGVGLENRDMFFAGDWDETWWNGGVSDDEERDNVRGAIKASQSDFLTLCPGWQRTNCNRDNVTTNAWH